MAINHRGYQVACRTKALTLSVAATTAFARASTATYTDVNGIVQTAPVNVLRNAHYVNGVLQPPLIEGPAINLALQSAGFSIATWSKSQVTVAADVTTAPDGTVTADTSVPSVAAGNHDLSQAITHAAVTYTLSVYAKPFGNSWVLLVYFNGAVTQIAAFNVTTGAAPTILNGTPTATIEPMANGWYRCSMTYVGAVGQNTVIIDSSPSGTIGGRSVAGDGVSGSYFWGADLKAEASVSSHVPTTTVPVTRAADIDQMFAATASGYSRQTGSFLTEGFAPGMEIAPLGYASNPVDTLTDVSALTLTTKSPRAVESALAGRSISVGLPLARAWENKKPPADPPVQGVPFVKEQYIPGPPAQQVTVGPLGDIELMPMYALHIHVPNNCGFEAASAYADAIMRLFTPRTAMAVGSEFLRVLARGPFRGQLLNSAPGFAVVPITAPLWIRTPNNI